MDMAAGFLEYFVSKEWANEARVAIELSTRSEDDDEFAAHYGLA